ncbi:hypothetical protein [Pelotomaculum propionicicum]|uniref:Ribbon-helix-helix protein CopG domain-containing protein n=1 Tax=Pelotomaculum propionicicum TaxID=258475 RepID=A0A4Y7RX74_9FIRM|nr:hypothetical protein [Pelotomaculum propionicicum]TEB13605.1 hypothetical protein Pmgp_00005 [Pelotomaculum propionicicum]
MANIYSRPKAYVSFQVRISPDLKEKLARRSFETGVSQASIVIAALQHYMDAGLTPQEDQLQEVEEGVLEDEDEQDDR